MTLTMLATVPLLLITTALPSGAVPSTEAAPPTTSAGVVSALEQIGRTQTASDISAVRAAGGAVLLTDPDTSEVVAAVSAETPLGRALNPVTPGCSTTSLCMRSAANVPYGYSGAGTRTGTWKNIAQMAPGDRRSRFEWTSGGLTLAPGETNIFGRPVTMKKISR
ncbi:hypothetical protein DEJ16_07470 [Curtobacterium sp. MCJR17_055]|uniref:hypothetical protein n=1 Tax=unclassified Curtobacterium TaxID=257496 RepID=UPI000D93BEED|nr:MULTISPECIES: hypothetical protein [unclassified Curtobacterium]PYY32426.1 hypothetical protein DEI87_14850 [Curtobacterium sp. MCBD17_029]PYY57160.1 hypothetical protein DEJ16_07470 [Curtobacterium sp. MCJR17_055]PYY61924.1 hypothetical protein DEJ26_00050 [Curtobacterium sp. MCPF17_015]